MGNVIECLRTLMINILINNKLDLSQVKLILTAYEKASNAKASYAKSAISPLGDNTYDDTDFNLQ